MARIARRTVTIGLATALLSMSLGVAPAFAGAESNFVNKVNAARQAKGKAKVEVYWDLTDDARSHSRKMAERQELFHTPNLGSVTTDWKALAENVGVGPSVDLIFDAFMNSSGHRANILGSYNYIGVGVKTDDAGRLWVTMIFMLGPDDLLDPDPDPPPTTTTTQPPPTTTQPPTTTTQPPPPTTQPPSTTTTTKPPSTTTTTKPPTTTTQPPSTTTTTVAPVEEPVVPYAVPDEELAVLKAGVLAPQLFRLIGSIGR
jgi:hypothetical protein